MLKPLWLTYPEIQSGSIGWRMGYGEEYALKFEAWFAGLTPLQRDAYERQYPEPPGWQGYYAQRR